jgi:hypothetical protein
MMHRVFHQLVAQAPVRRAPVKHRQPLGPRLPQPGLEEFGEQRVVAEPLALVVQRRDEQVGAL